MNVPCVHPEQTVGKCPGNETSVHPGIEKQKEDVGQPPDTKTKQTWPSFSQ